LLDSELALPRVGSGYGQDDEVVMLLWSCWTPFDIVLVSSYASSLTFVLLHSLAFSAHYLKPAVSRPRSAAYDLVVSYTLPLFLSHFTVFSSHLTDMLT